MLFHSYLMDISIMHAVIKSALSLIILTTSSVQASQNWNLRDADGRFDPSFSQCQSNRIVNSSSYPFGNQKLHEQWNISDNTDDFKCDNREATSYVVLFNKKQHTFEFSDFIDRFQQLMTEAFLTDVNLGLGRRAEKLPNIAMGRLTFHYRIGNKAYDRTFDLETLYLAGPHFFKNDGRAFKARHKIMTANEDMLTEAEKAIIYAEDPDLRGFHINKIMEKRLRKEVIGGPYIHNAMHSESLLMLDMVQRLPGFLTQLEKLHPDHNIELLGLFLGIASHRDSCGNCNQVIYGFQRASKDILSCMLQTQNLGTKSISISENFGTVAMTYGQVRVLKGKGASIPTRMVEGNQWLKERDHRLVRIFNHKASEETHEDSEDDVELQSPPAMPSPEVVSRKKGKGEWTTVGKKNPNNDRVGGAAVPKKTVQKKDKETPVVAVSELVASADKKDKSMIILSPALQALFNEQDEMPIVRMRSVAKKSPAVSNDAQKETVRKQKSVEPQPTKQNQWVTVGASKTANKKKKKTE
jgi:hypothetical protein